MDEQNQEPQSAPVEAPPEVQIEEALEQAKEDAGHQKEVPLHQFATVSPAQRCTAIGQALQFMLPGQMVPVNAPNIQKCVNVLGNYDVCVLGLVTAYKTWRAEGTPENFAEFEIWMQRIAQIGMHSWGMEPERKSRIIIPT